LNLNVLGFFCNGLEIGVAMGVECDIGEGSADIALALRRMGWVVMGMRVWWQWPGFERVSDAV